MRGDVAMIGLRESLQFESERIDEANLRAMATIADGVKEDWRDQVVAAGLGQPLARAVRSRVYANRDRGGNPAAFVWSKAPQIMSLFASGATIRAVNGARYLWIPTENVPRGRRRRAATPEDVRARFGPFIYRPSSRTPGNLVALVAARGSKARRGQPQRLIHMFTLARQRRGTKRIELEGIALAWANRSPGLILAELEAPA